MTLTRTPQLTISKEKPANADKNFQTERASGYTGQLDRNGEEPTKTNTDSETLAFCQRAAASFAKHS